MTEGMTARSIVLNKGESIQIPRTAPRFILYPYNTEVGVDYDANRLMLQVVRPVSVMMPKRYGRYCKDKVYLAMQAHCGMANCSGSYVGLAANYMGEIFVNFSPFVNGKFYCYETDLKSYNDLVIYKEFVTAAFPKKKFDIDFEVIRGDIIKEMLTLERVASVIDLDLMEGIGKKDGHGPKDIAESVNACAKDNAVLALWQTAGRNNGWTDKEINEIVRPACKSALTDFFHVKKHDEINYWEGYPMRCDIFTLERKTKWKKALSKQA